MQRINVIEANSSIKVISLIKDEAAKKPTLDKIIIEETDLDQTLKLVALRRIMTDNNLTNADINIFLLSTQLVCQAQRVANSIDKQVISKQLKDIMGNTSGDSIKDTILGFFKSKDNAEESRHLYVYDYQPSDYEIQTLLYSVSDMTIKDYTTLARVLNLQNVVLTDFEHLGKLDASNYNIIDVGRSKVKVIKVEDNKVAFIESSTEGTDNTFKQLGISTDESYSVNNTSLTELKEDRKVVFDNVRKMRNNVMPEGLCYITGGGGHCPFIDDTPSRVLKPLSECTKRLIANGDKIPSPLYPYIDTLILAGAQSFEEQYPYNILGSQLDIKSPLARKVVHSIPMLKTGLKISVASMVITGLFLMSLRGVTNAKLYEMEPLEMLKAFPSSLTQIEKIEKRPVSDVTQQQQELSDLYDQVSDRIMAFDELGIPSQDGTRFNIIYDDTHNLTTANLVSLTSSDKVSSLTFRGYIGDISKVEKILEPHYNRVEYEIKGVDDLNTFSVLNFVFTCYE